MSRFPTEADDRPQPKVWRSPWKRMLIFVIAWGFILLGILGVLLPIMPGVIFLIIGIYLMSLESLWINRQLDRLGRRYPRFGEISDDARVRAQRILHRIFRDE